MKLIALGIAVCALTAAGASVKVNKGKKSPEKKFFKQLKKKIRHHLKENFDEEEVKKLKRKWQRWKRQNHREFKDQNEDGTKFEFFLENEMAVKEALHRHLNLTLDGPFADMTNSDFKKKVLMPDREVNLVNNGKKRIRRQLKSEWQAQKGWPIEIPEWIKECAPHGTCGLDDIEFSWDCAEPKTYTQEEIDFALTQHVDLRTDQNKWGKPLVTPVKDQGMCGSCWSFSATGAMESLMLKEGTAPMKGGTNSAHPDIWWGLSEQQLIDCTFDRKKLGPFVNHDCSGGWPSNSFVYSTISGGWMSEEEYPYISGYTFGRGLCEEDDMEDALKENLMNDQVSGKCYMVTPENEEELAAAVYYHGAISIVVDAAGADWQLYRGGIVSPQGCQTHTLNHAVLLVGYGEENGEKYWIVRNSWGEWWGENGYIRLKRGDGNVCGVATMPHYPTYEAYPAW